jgi:hypothetical protein
MAAANFLLLGNVLMVWRMARIFARGFPRLLADMALIYLVPLPLFAAAALLPASSWWRLAASALAAVAGMGLLAWRFWRPVRLFLDGRVA